MKLLRSVSRHNCSEILSELLLQLHRSLKQFPRLLLRHPLVHLQQRLDGLGLKEDS